jgi:phenylpropionate dioxygenase-like ring-hydroxylating dioxygenase large terminal subunit
VVDLTNADIDGLRAAQKNGSAQRCTPPAAYASDRYASAEQSDIFAKGWVPIGRADRVKGPGDYETLEIAGRSLILLRDADNLLHCHANTCRHRSARLLDGTGNTRGIRCPFHAWLYRLDGTLAAAPRIDEVDGFQKCDHGLISYRLEVRAGFLFTTFDENAPDIDPWLGNFEALHSDWPLAELVQTRSWTRTFNFNWKAFLDVFNEYYHLPYVHRDSIDAVYDDPAAGNVTTGAFASQFGATQGTGGLLTDQQEHALPAMPGLKGLATSGVRYTWVFPSMTFACSGDAIWIYQSTPLGPHQCRVTQSMCFHPDTIASDGFAKTAEVYYERMDTALDEDIAALENQHAGLRSPDATAGPFCQALEPNVASFARWYAGRMLSTNEANDA